MKKQIKLKTEKEFKDLLSQGYQVVNTYSRLAWSKKEDSEGFDYNYGYIFLEKNNEQLVVDTSNLGELFPNQLLDCLQSTHCAAVPMREPSRPADPILII